MIVTVQLFDKFMSVFMFVLTRILETNVLFWVQTHVLSQDELLHLHACRLINHPLVGMSANLA